MKIAKVAVPAPIIPFNNLYDYLIPDEISQTILPGSLVTVPLGKRKTYGVVFHIEPQSSLDPKKLKPISKLIAPVPVFDPSKLQLLRWLSNYYFYPIGEVCEAAIPACIRNASDKLLDKAFKNATPWIESVTPGDVSNKKLNPAQANAIATILATDKSSHLLFGVTGSGKTEVYLRIIEECLNRKKSALVLVPEIALTPQLQNRFEERFPGEVAVFHSAQKPTELRRNWIDVLVGKKRIALGARSAIFTPVQNLGVIIVDEEHDNSYKQEDRLRYNARDTAIELARLSQCKLVLGSATPSSESLFLAASDGLTVSKLPSRAVADTPLPEVEIVDLKKNIAVQNKDPIPLNEAGPNTNELELGVEGDFFLSPLLKQALTETLAKNQQSILFLNRRGLGSQELCRGCGHTLSCPNCDVNLTPHKQSLICHYCAFEIVTPKECPNCLKKNRPFLRVGVGTEAIESALKVHFPEAKVLRLDRDSVQTHEELTAVIDQFKHEKADILIGTQMVAKGHDFPQVTFVGILLAELGLTVPDFRAYEKNLQLLLQVCGRAGRGLHPGKVVLQTFQPDHPVFEQLKNQKTLEDYEQFIRLEMEKRKALYYPPCSQMAILRFDGLTQHLVSDAAALVAQSLSKIDSNALRILGPVPSPIFKIRNRYRWQVLLKASSEHVLNKGLNWILTGWQKNGFEKKFKTRFIVDRDPVQML